MSTQMIQSLNKDIAAEREKIFYPYVEILTPSDCVALVLPNLPNGDLPVLCEYENKRRVIGKIAKSAVSLKHLLDITGLKYHKTQYDVIEIKCVEDCLEVLL